MPLFRLRKHQANSSDEDILINSTDYNGLKLLDVVEIKSPKSGPRGGSNDRILLQVRKWPDPPNAPNCVSIKDTIVNSISFKLLYEVLINIVDKRDVLIDSIEICFSNAYLARSYMWGLRNHLNNRCVYQRQKLDYLQIRSQICEIWAHGDKITSGFVDESTKIVFRSASSLVYLFIQMSSEMWDYDINGDLYCEKTINGFLTDLFETWRKNDCSHDITMILFSRTFYDAKSLDEFPKEMRECLQIDNKNRFYEDCYRVALQNDRFDLHDWNAKLTALKSLFNQYQKEVIDRHQDKYDMKIPRAYNSSASQGNFLEVLNMSLNVFEKHYFDRSFDRTGQLSVVVSPGVGVFEADFELTNLTKQRIIDNGIGSDLVCLGEQPLHTVPLLKLRSKSPQSDDNLATGDVYNMPHWINLSFYSSQNQVYYSNFIPRIKLPTIHTKLNRDSSKSNLNDNARTVSQGEREHLNHPQDTCRPITSSTASTVKSPSEMHATSNHIVAPNNTIRQHPNNHSTTIPDLVDYDDYDAQVFKPNPIMNYRQHQYASRTDRSILIDLDSNVDPNMNLSDDDFLDRDGPGRVGSGVQRRSSDVKNYKDYARNMKRRQFSDNLPICPTRASPQPQSIFSRMSLGDTYLADVKVKPGSADDLSVRGYNVQTNRMNRSNGRPKALINPFDPSHMTIKLTPNRRRWTHVFPQGPAGAFIQQHHYQPIIQEGIPAESVDVSSISTPENDLVKITSIKSDLIGKGRSASIQPSQPTGKSVITNLAKKWSDSLTSSIGLNNSKSALVSNETIRFAWCASGEQEWTPAITTGVDWKSLTMPACLPLTTDFFPSKTSLQNDYVIGEYNIDSVYIHSRYTLIEVYRELVCQRLQKGFQIILLPRKSPNSGHHEKGVASASSIHGRTSSLMKRQKASQQLAPEIEAETERTEYTLSIGRIFHKLSLDGNTITVTQYKPRHPYPNIKIDYCYRFRAPFHENYGQSWVHFRAEKLEEYNWNYLDHYICNGGELQLRSNMNFWRFRILVVPSGPSLRKISREGVPALRHDVYHLEFSNDESAALMGSFVKLLEIINKTRRASASRLSSSSVPPVPSSSSSGSQSQAAPNNMNCKHSSNRGSVSIESIHTSTRLNVHIASNQNIEGQSQRTSQSESLNDLKFESITMDIDTALRDAKRAEWVHVQYHNFYSINQAFELVIKWMVASGAGIAEMVQGWSRKAGNSSVHLIPCPWEPFAFPHSGKADPLRCPIGIKLRLDSLPPEGQSLDDNQVVMLQEKMLLRYGFIRFHDLISTENIDRQYVHNSGFAFVALPNIVNDEEAVTLTQTKVPSKENSLSSDQPVMVTTSGKSSSRLSFLQNKTKGPVVPRQLEQQDTISSPHEEYITRHISGARKNYTSRLRGKNEQVEFIWSWNYMLTKRWRSASTQDESYAVSLMQDFKDFCQNGSNRLVEFWREIGETL